MGKKSSQGTPCQILTPPTIFCDNLSVTYLYENHNLHSRMKHIIVYFHYVRQQIIDKSLTFEHIPTFNQLADSLIKPLSKTSFHRHLSNLGVVAHHLVWGRCIRTLFITAYCSLLLLYFYYIDIYSVSTILGI